MNDILCIFGGVRVEGLFPGVCEIYIIILIFNIHIQCVPIWFIGSLIKKIRRQKYEKHSVRRRKIYIADEFLKTVHRKIAKYIPRFRS